MKLLLKNKRGFTLIELMVVIATTFILSSIAIYNYIPLKRKAHDTVALSDARNLADAIIDAILYDVDVKYDKNGSGAVGAFDTNDNPRPPVFELSSGVAVNITGSSAEIDGSTTVVTAIVYHTRGTVDVGSGSGRKEYTLLVDEASGTADLP